jgi:hypothetical protein
MGRIRTIKPEFYTHEDLFLAEKEEKLPLRIAFSGLWTICDREGRFKWRPNTIKLAVLPFDEVDFSRVLDALATRGFIEQYATDTGELFGFVPSFLEHQVINNRESKSLIPSHSDAYCTRDPRGLRKIKGKGMEGKGKEEEWKGRSTVDDTPKKNAAAMLAELGVEYQAAKDWLTIRKAKKAPLTQTALDDLVREAGKAGITVNEAVTICARRSWQGFNSSWDWKGDAKNNSSGTHAEKIARYNEQVAKEFLGGQTIEGEVIRD